MHTTSIVSLINYKLH